MTNYPDLKQYAAELADLENAPHCPIELPPLAAIALVSLVQLASRHPSVGDNSLVKIAIDTARQIQGLFNSESATYKVLELGWNPDEDRPFPGHPSLNHPVFDATKFDENYPLWNEPDEDDEYVPRHISRNEDRIEDYDGEAVIDSFRDPEQEPR